MDMHEAVRATEGRNSMDKQGMLGAFPALPDLGKSREGLLNPSSVQQMLRSFSLAILSPRRGSLGCSREVRGAMKAGDLCESQVIQGVCWCMVVDHSLGGVAGFVATAHSRCSAPWSCRKMLSLSFPCLSFVEGRHFHSCLSYCPGQALSASSAPW